MHFRLLRAWIHIPNSNFEIGLKMLEVEETPSSPNNLFQLMENYLDFEGEL